MSCPHLTLAVKDADDEYYTVDLCYVNPWVVGGRPEVSVHIKRAARSDAKASLDFDNPAASMGFDLSYEEVVILRGFLRAAEALLRNDYAEYLDDIKASPR